MRYRSPAGDSWMLRIEDSLRRALMLLYEQPNQRCPRDLVDDGNHWFALRLALARLADSVLVYLSLNEASGVRMRGPDWMYIMGPAAEDNRILGERGLLAPVDKVLLEAGGQLLDESGQHAVL